MTVRQQDEKPTIIYELQGLFTHGSTCAVRCVISFFFFFCFCWFVAFVHSSLARQVQPLGWIDPAPALSDVAMWLQSLRASKVLAFTARGPLRWFACEAPRHPLPAGLSALDSSSLKSYDDGHSIARRRIT